ncbi:MAG: DUF1801 domain-containing protein [Verrucomicrobia bacterium]|nr:DUF1801 domain-containing protein [Verrucomicrobiota bacterium]
MKRIDAGVKAYFESVEPADRPVLETLRKWVLKALPAASETMIYGMPTYLLSEPVVAFKRQKNYFSLYICQEGALAAHAEALGKLNCGKGCIRFRRLDQLPADVIARILEDAGRRAGLRDLPSAGGQGAAAC